jgi:prephenate dehydrogenase
MMMEICRSNRENIIQALESVQGQISSLLNNLKDNDSTGLRVQLDRIAQDMNPDARET